MTDSGLVTIDCDQDDVYWIKQKQPSFSSILEGAIIADLLSIDACEIDERYPIQVVSTGLPVIIVPIKKLSALKKVKIDHGIYYELIEELEAKGICVFSTETYSKRADINVRDFAPYYGIDEDATTGSSNGSILAYLKRYKVFQSKNLNLISEQGYEIKRPSTLYLRSIDKDMYVGGKIKKVPKGEWFLNNT
ncbi:PhzF family phenazine biosynthesis protein [Shouchella lehensis]|uniref:PhzF family phenazine biosynthesis protein n=1 Tax=Shouchella lehensis TaxID=300825 RepID=UPI001419B9E3|nr:PhzF family phenazine biosynthesis isomerase [Shouchella lehensis]